MKGIRNPATIKDVVGDGEGLREATRDLAKKMRAAHEQMNGQCLDSKEVKPSTYEWSTDNVVHFCFLPKGHGGSHHYVSALTGKTWLEENKK